MEVTAVLWKSSHAKKTGLYSIKVRMTKMIAGKPDIKYSLPIMDPILITQWEPIGKCVIKHPDAQVYNLEIMKQVVEHTKKYGDTDLTYSKDKESFYWWYEEYLRIIKPKMKAGCYDTYVRPLVLLKKFRPQLKLNQFNLAFIMGFESYLLQKGRNVNYIYMLFGKIKEVTKIIVGSGVLEYHKNPLLNYKIKQLKDEKERLNEEEMKVLKNAVNLTTVQKIERDWFLIRYYCGGMRYVDSCKIRKLNFVDGRLKYKMSKTGVKIDIPIPEAAKELLEPYNYEYPFKVKIVEEYTEVFSQDPKEDYRIKVDKVDTRIKTRYGCTRDTLRIICKKLNIKIATPHSAKHSLADHALKMGLTPAEIQGQLGHKNLSMTVVYLKAIHQDVTDEGSNKLWSA